MGLFDKSYSKQDILRKSNKSYFEDHEDGEKLAEKVNINRAVDETVEKMRRFISKCKDGFDFK